jgi:hypothetical protein
VKTELEVTDIHPFETMGHEYEGNSVVLIGYICKAVEILLSSVGKGICMGYKEEALGMDMVG